MAVANTLAYYDTAKITTEKSFIVQAIGKNIWSDFDTSTSLATLDHICKKRLVATTIYKHTNDGLLKMPSSWSTRGCLGYWKIKAFASISSVKHKWDSITKQKVNIFALKSLKCHCQIHYTSSVITVLFHSAKTKMLEHMRCQKWKHLRAKRWVSLCWRSVFQGHWNSRFSYTGVN
jgi:hypothetical protein